MEWIETRHVFRTFNPPTYESHVSCTSLFDLPVADLIDQRGDVFWGCLNRDAMAEVEYKRSGAERSHNAGCLNSKM